MKYKVYAIINPITEKPFYIGHSGDYKRRKKQHIKGTDQLSGQIVRQIKAKGLLPIFTILEEFGEADTALRSEIFWIETMAMRNIDVMNSQAFNGVLERKERWKKENQKARRFERLMKVANGKGSKRSYAKPILQEKDGWTELETRQLLGAQKAGIPIRGMSRMFGRPISDIRNKLSREWTPRLSDEFGK